LNKKYQALEVKYRKRMYELNQLKEHVMSRGYPHSSLLENDDKMTSFYTGLPSYSIVKSVLLFIDKVSPCRHG